MTVCVAAVCESGQKIVIATDRRLSYAGVAGDALAAKMVWFGDWIFLYAGAPSLSDLILEEIRFTGPLERKTLHERINDAYRKAKAKFCAHAVLSPYDLTMEEFKADGLRMFGEKIFAHLSQEIEQEGSCFNEQLLVIGYGDSERSANVYEIGPSMVASHILDGIGAIGSGREIALSNLLILEQARHSSLQDTLYSVAAAKFSAEMSQDLDVGPTTAMYVTWKRGDIDPADHPAGRFLDAQEIDDLRKVWRNYGRPRIPVQASPSLLKIVQGIRAQRSEQLGVDDAVLAIEANEQNLAEERARQSAAQTLKDRQ